MTTNTFLDAPMNTAVTAWKNSQILAMVGFNPVEIENYRAVYIRAFDFGVSAAMRAAGDTCPAIGMAIEDADCDRSSMGLHTT